MSGRPADIRAEDLPELARIYNTAIEIGQSHRVNQIVGEWFGVSRSTVQRHVRSAAEAGLLTEFAEDGHRPIRVRPVQGGSSWVTCGACRQPWPCPSSHPSPTPHVQEQ